jgi:cardiolipin synthase
MTDGARSLAERRVKPERHGQRRAADRWSWSEIERATGAPTICGNELRLQFEGSNTFATWLEAIEAAEKFVYFENYLLRDDAVGREFRDALIAKAREGVPVYLIHDWLGCWATPRSYWKPFREGGVRVHAFNPPAIRLGDPFGAVQRDHRKLVVVDGEVAHVGGLCVGVEWAGTPTAAPWRDTGVEIRGPAARAAALAFERVWSQIGDEPLELAGVVEPVPDEGGTPVWLIEGEPGRARVYRTLHLTASRAMESIWITDAYFVAPRPLTEALAAAAQQGVDVRILVPAHHNWPIVGSMSRGGYRFLLESGVRLFEWQGPMIHAKTAVVDGVWCRVGSSNLNGASLMGNWELDVGVLDTGLGRQLAGLFMADLASSVEIVLPGKAAVRPGAVSTGGGISTESLDPEGSLPRRLEQQIRTMRQRPGRLTLASIVRAREAFGAALAGDRQLGREDRTVLGLASTGLIVVAFVAALVPAAIGWLVVVSAGWLGLTTGARAFLQARRARSEERAAAAARRTREVEEAQ